MCCFVLFCFLFFLCLRFFSPDLPADTWQLHDGCVSGLLGPAREALNSRSASAKVSSDSFTSSLCRYLRNYIKDVKQDRRKKSVSDASVEAARKEKNHLKKIARRRESTPQDRMAFHGAIRSHSQLKRIHEQAQRDKDAIFTTLQRKPLLVLLGAGVIHPSSRLELQIGTTLKSTRFQLGSSRAI
jgi:hypothetical protein